MKFKKLMALGIAIAMLATTLVACGNTNDVSNNTSENDSNQASQTSSSTEEVSGEITFPLAEKVVFTCMGFLHDETKPLSKSTTWKYLQERANVEFDMVVELPSAEAKEKGNLIMASGDYPDFLYKMSSLDINSYGIEGSLIPLEDMIKEHMPNLCALLDERDGWAEITASDGHIYALPGIDYSQWEGRSNVSLMLNYKWLRNLGLDVPTSMEGLYEVLKAFKEKDPNGNGINDEIPLNARGIYPENGIAALQIYMGGASHYYKKHLAVKDGELILYPSDDLFREWLEWMIKFYKEGLLYEDFLTQSHEQYKAVSKGSEIDNVGGMFTNRVFVYTHEQYFSDYESMPSFDPDLVARSKGIKQGALAITDKCENPEILLAWADYMYTTEGGFIACNGLEGETWIRTAEGTIEKLLVEEYPENAGGLAGSASLPAYMAAPAPDETSTVMMTNMADLRESEAYTEGHAFYGGIYLPTLTLGQEETENANIILTDITSCVDTFIAETMTGVKELNDDTWNEFKETLKAMRADEYLGYYQAAYEKAAN